jgi:hypothetical protein
MAICVLPHYNADRISAVPVTPRVIRLSVCPTSLILTDLSLLVQGNHSTAVGLQSLNIHKGSPPWFHGGRVLLQKMVIDQMHKKSS